MSTAPNTTTTDSIDSLAPVVTSKLYTPEELLTLPDQKIYELVDGRLVEKNMGGNSSWIGQELNRHVGNFVYEHGLGLLWGPDCSYQIFGDDSNKIRRPDGSFIAKGRLPDDLPPEGHIQICPDLVIEVVSPHDLATYIDGKVEECLQAGVRLIWIVYPKTKHVLVYRSGSSVQRLGVDDELSGEDVLPDFRLAIHKLFPVAGED
jgi:Uma2 family endonuclease